MEDGRCRFYAATDGVAQARALDEASRGLVDESRRLQYRTSFAEWCNLVDRGERFTARTPGRMDTTAGGILGIDVDIPSPDSPMRVTGAHIEGLPSDARRRFKDEAGAATIADITPSGAGMTVRVIQEGHSPGLFRSGSSARVRVPLESTPSRRGNPLPVPMTGHQGMFIIDRVRRLHSPGFAGESYDYSQVPIGAKIIWAHEVSGIRIADLPVIGG